jgi:Ca2+-binding RTX toxin-like protein
MTTINSRRRRTALLASALLMLSGVAFAPQALATQFESGSTELPDCFGTYVPGSHTADGGMIGLGNVIYAQPGAAVTYGTSGDDVIIGTDGPDFINGMEGNDRICAGDGVDTALGGPGEYVDHIDGEGGSDVRIDGGPGNDVLYGGNGDDDIRDESGNDALFGQRGNDYLICAGGTDTADGGLGVDGPDHSSGCEIYPDAE